MKTKLMLLGLMLALVVGCNKPTEPAPEYCEQAVGEATAITFIAEKHPDLPDNGQIFISGRPQINPDGDVLRVRICVRYIVYTDGIYYGLRLKCTGSRWSITDWARE